MSILGSNPVAVADLERAALRLGMCFRISSSDLEIFRSLFPVDLPATLFRNGAAGCIEMLREKGLITLGDSRHGNKYYRVPFEINRHLENAYIKNQRICRKKYASHRKLEHKLLGEAFVEQSHVGPPALRLRSLAEALVQMRHAEAWSELDRLFHASGMHLFGYLDHYIIQACGSLPREVVRQYPALAIGASKAELVTGNQTTPAKFGVVSGRPKTIPFEATASRINTLIKVHGPQWQDQSTVDGRLFLGIHWVRFHRERGDIEAARDLVNRILKLLPEHAAQGDPPTESNLHWLESERGLLEFMAANWSASYTHLKRAVELTYDSAQPGMYLPRLACSALALQLAITGDREGSSHLHRQATALLDENGDQSYIRFTLDLSRLILSLDELDLDNAKLMTDRLIPELYNIEIWGIAVRFIQIFNILSDERTRIRTRLDATRLHGPDLRSVSPLTYSQVKKSEVEANEALGNIHRLRDQYRSRSVEIADNRNGYARLQLIGRRYDRALRTAQAALDGEVTTLRDRGTSAALIAASYLGLKDLKNARTAVTNCLELSIEAATLLPFALLPRGVRSELIALAEHDPLFGALAESVGIDRPLMLERLNKLGQCFPEEAPLVDLTRRERVVLWMLDEDQPQSCIARRLHVSLSTVKKHVGSLYRKLGAKGRNDALSKAYEIGLFDDLSSVETESGEQPQ